jgi:head-tail adaptor
MKFDGSKTEKVILQQRQIVRNENNESIIGWENNDREIYAEFWQRHAKQEDIGGQTATEIELRCNIRWVSGLNHKAYRIMRGGEIYEILSVVEIPRRKGLSLILKQNIQEI